MFNIFKKNSDTTSSDVPKRFFSVLLSPNLVQAAMWEAADIVKVLAKSPTRPYFNDNDLLVKLDQCLQDLGKEGESVHQTLFHLDSSFILGDDLAPDKQTLFQQITEQLQLESLGFVANTESVINAKLETNPELTRQLVIEFTPSKTIYSLFDGKSLLESLSESPESNFAEQFKSVLVQLAGKIGADYTGFFEVSDELPTNAPSEPLIVNLISGQITSEELQAKLDTLPTNFPLKAEVLGSEILLSYILLPSATIIATSYGWIKKPEPEEKPAASIPPEQPVEAEPMPVLSRQRQAQTAMVPSVNEQDFALSVPKKEKKPLSHGAKMGLMVLVLSIVMILAVGGIFWWLVQSGVATVTLSNKHDFLAKTIEVSIDPEAKEANYEKAILPGTVKVGNLQVDIEYPTTGKKNVGEKANGKVEIINKSGTERKIAAGTELENGEVSFVTKDEITLEAAKEKDDHSGKEYTKKDVDVVAVSVGTAGNIKKNTSLRVGAAVKDDVEAVAKEDFTGGTDKTVKIFSAEDREAALKLAEQELAASAAEQIDEKKGKVYQVPQLEDLEVTSSSFDTEVDAEAESVSLTVKGTVPVISFSQDDFLPLAKAAIDKLLPEGYALDGEMELLSTLDEKKTARGNGQIYVKLDLTQRTVSVVDVEEIKSQLLGQNLTKVANILDRYEGIEEYTVNWNSQLTPTITGSLPKDSKKLKVVLSEAEE